MITLDIDEKVARVVGEWTSSAPSASDRGQDSPLVHVHFQYRRPQGGALTLEAEMREAATAKTEWLNATYAAFRDAFPEASEKKLQRYMTLEEWNLRSVERALKEFPGEIREKVQKEEIIHILMLPVWPGNCWIYTTTLKG